MKRKILISVFLLTVLCGLIVFATGIGSVAVGGRRLVRERLEAESALLVALIQTEEDVEGLSGYRNSSAFRITVIRENGEVIYESNLTGAMENHATRPEIAEAFAGQPQFIERHSATFGCKMTYYAVCDTLENGERVAIRVAAKSSETDRFLGVAIPALALSLLLALSLSWILSGRLSASVSEKIRGVSSSLRSLNEGEYRPIQTDSREPEFFSVFHEINDLNQKTCELIEARTAEGEKLAFVLETVTEAIIALDRSRNVMFANHAATSIFDGGRYEMGKPLYYLVDDAELCRRLIDAGNTHVESAIGDRDFLITVRLPDAAMATHPIEKIIILTDITSVKAVAKEKSDFFANASHELKTPITVTQGISEIILAKPELDEGMRKHVERIHNEAVRMARLISDMLKLSAAERQRGTMEKTPVDLRAIADEVLAELNDKIAEKSLTVRVLGRGQVLASADNIYELVCNLCTNAVNYNKDGGAIDVTIGEEEKRVQLTVRDTGIGIPAEHLARIFERFYRVDPSRSKKTGGTGLGLAIVKHICQMYGATISVESRPGEGTVFRVLFP